MPRFHSVVLSDLILLTPLLPIMSIILPRLPISIFEAWSLLPWQFYGSFVCVVLSFLLVPGLFFFYVVERSELTLTRWFLTLAIGIASWTISSSVGNLIGLPIMTLSNYYESLLLLMGLLISIKFLYGRASHRGGSRSILAHHVRGSDLNHPFFYCLVIATVVFGYLIYLRAVSVPLLDLVPNVATSLEMIRSGSFAGEVHISSSLTQTLPGLPWFQLSQAVFLETVSGPALNSIFLLVVPFNILISIGLYLLFSRFLPRDIPGRSTIAWAAVLFFTFFSGFGWLLLPFKSTAAIAAMTALDTMYPYSFEIIDGFRDSSFALILGTAAILLLDNPQTFRSWGKYLAISILVFGALLANPAIGAILIVLSLFYLALSGRFDLISLARDTVFLSFGGVLFLLITLSSSWSGFSIYLASAIVLAFPLVTLMSALVRVILLRFVNWVSRFSLKKHMAAYPVALLIALYVYSLLLWSQAGFTSETYTIIPWYIYPLRFGILGILAVAAFTTLFLRGSSDKNILFLVTAAFSSFFVLNLTAEFYGQFLTASRMIEYINLLMALLVAYYLYSFLQRHSKIVKILTVGSIIVLGCSSTILALQFWSYSGSPLLSMQVLSHEQPALEYLYTNRPVGTTVAAIDWQSISFVDLAGTERRILSPVEPFLEESNPFSFLMFRSVENIGYVYDSERDSPFLMGQPLLNYIVNSSIDFPSSTVSLLQLSNCLPPQEDSTVSLLLPTSDYLDFGLACSGIPYQVRLPFDAPLGSTLIVDDAAFAQSNFTDIPPNILNGFAEENNNQSAAYYYARTPATGEWLWMLWNTTSSISTNSFPYLDVSGIGSTIPTSTICYVEVWNQTSKIFSHILGNGSGGSFQDVFTMPSNQYVDSIVVAIDTGTYSNISGVLNLTNLALSMQENPSVISGATLENSVINAVMNGAHVYVIGTQNPSAWITSILGLNVQEQMRATSSINFNGSIILLSNSSIVSLSSDMQDVNSTGQYIFSDNQTTPMMFSRSLGQGVVSYVLLPVSLGGATADILNTVSRPLVSDILDLIIPHEDHSEVGSIPSFLGYMSNFTINGPVTISSRAFWNLSSSVNLESTTPLTFSSLSVIGGIGPYVQVIGELENGDSAHLLCFTPTINGSGTLSSNWAYLEPPLPILQYNAPMRLEGAFSFKVESAGTFVYIDQVEFHGVNVNPITNVFSNAPTEPVFQQESANGLAISELPILFIFFVFCLLPILVLRHKKIE